MYLEDYITTVADVLLTKSYATLGTRSGTVFLEAASKDWEFLSSIGNQIDMGRTLTTRQGAAIKKLFNRILADPEALQKKGVDIEAFKKTLASNNWKNPLRVSVQRRNEVRHLGDNIICLSGNLNEPEMRLSFKRFKGVWRDKMYIVLIDKSNLDKVIEFIGRWDFEIDRATEEYLALCLSSVKEISHFICSGNDVAVNVCDNVLLGHFIHHICGGEVI